MTRPLRIELAGGLYHITSRGDRREDIFLDDQDRKTWLEGSQKSAAGSTGAAMPIVK